MTRAQKIGDFLFGVALIGGTPIVMLCLVSFAVRLAFGSASISPLILLSGVAAFVASCVWRWKRRLLPSSFFIAEVLTAILAAGIFMVTYVVVGYAAFGAD